MYVLCMNVIENFCWIFYSLVHLNTDVYCAGLMLLKQTNTLSGNINHNRRRYIHILMTIQWRELGNLYGISQFCKYCRKLCFLGIKPLVTFKKTEINFDVSLTFLRKRTEKSLMRHK